MDLSARLCPECRHDLNPTIAPVRAPDFFVRVPKKGPLWSVTKDGPGAKERASAVAYRCPACGLTLQMVAT